MGEKEKEKEKEETSAKQEEYVTSHNPYLYDSSGPRRQIDYSKPDNYDDSEDQVMYEDYEEEKVQGAGTATNADGSYSVKHENEKFSILPSGK